MQSFVSQLYLVIEIHTLKLNKMKKNNKIRGRVVKIYYYNFNPLYVSASKFVHCALSLRPCITIEVQYECVHCSKGVGAVEHFCWLSKHRSYRDISEA